MAMNKCIFCLSEGDIFHTIEHIVPESLGNTDDILEDCVCDKCQNYFGKEIENYVLAKTPFGFWRTIAGTINKKGKQPFFNPHQNPKQRGPIPDFHPHTDNGFIVHPADGETIMEAEITDELCLKDIIEGKKDFFKIVLTPKMLIYMGRFLGKVALEYWAKAYGADVFRKDFDLLRQYVRLAVCFIWSMKAYYLFHLNIASLYWSICNIPHYRQNINKEKRLKEKFAGRATLGDCLVTGSLPFVTFMRRF